MAKVFTAVIRARDDVTNKVVAELEIMTSFDRMEVERYIEGCGNFAESKRAHEFLQSFYVRAIIAVEMKL